MSNTQEYLTTGRHTRSFSTNNLVPQASSQNSLRIVERNNLPSKIVNERINDKYYKQNMIRNNHIDKNQQYYDFKDNNKNVDNMNPIHKNEVPIYHRKKVANQNQDFNKTFNNTDYSNKLQNNYLEQKQNKQVMKQNHMFVTRPLFRLQDSKQEQVRSTNPEMPDWAVTTTKFYSKNYREDLINYKRQQKNQPKCNIMGQLVQKYPKDTYNYFLELPHPTQKSENTRMVVVENKRKVAASPKKSNVRLQWNENTSKQHFDKKVEKKIGNDVYVKQTRNLFVPEYPIQDRVMIIKEKPVQIKIGHGKAEYLKNL